MLASAQRIQLDNAKALKKQVARRQEWQDEAWDYFDEVPEIKYSVWFLGNAMGKLRLYAAVRPDPDADPIPVDDPKSGVAPDLASRAMAEVARLTGEFGGQGEICRVLNMNLEIAAECYLVGIGPRIEQEEDELGNKYDVVEPEDWSIRSVNEVEVTGSGKSTKYKVKQTPDDQKPVTLDPRVDSIIRIWQRHPRYSFLPDNNMRGVLAECERLILLGNQISAEAKSQMSAGVFTVPNELNFGPADGADQETDEGGDEEDELDVELRQVTVEPTEDPDSPAIVNPMTLRGPGEYLQPQYVRHIRFGRDGSSVLEDRIQKRVERIARGMNLPVEVVMGHQQTTFANAAQVDADTFEDHLQPRAELLCDALTVGFLHPNLYIAGYDEAVVAPIIVWYDAAHLIREVDPSESADSGHDKGLISDEAWRRVKGWTEDDAPTPEEVLVRAVLHLRSFDPGVSTAILELLGVPLDIPAQLPGSGTAAPAASAEKVTLEDLIVAVVDAKRALLQSTVEPKLTASARVAGDKLTAASRRRSAPGRRLSSIDVTFRTRLHEASNKVVRRVVERAGNVLKSKRPKKGNEDVRAIVRGVHPFYAASHLGPKLVAAAGFHDEDLIPVDAWDELEGQFRTWGANAQTQALDVVNQVVGITTAERDHLLLRQAADLDESWSWFRDALHSIAHDLLYNPDMSAPAIGEFDPSSLVPTGMVREALSRAGGATALTEQGGNPFVVLNAGDPAGGIGTGQLVMSTLIDGGASVEGYEWDYGSAFRSTPFPEHEDLDGLTFSSFDDQELSAEGSWIDAGFYYPGDHDGCACDVTPVILGPDDVVINEATGDATYADDQPEA